MGAQKRFLADEYELRPEVIEPDQLHDFDIRGMDPLPPVKPVLQWLVLHYECDGHLELDQYGSPQMQIDQSPVDRTRILRRAQSGKRKVTVASGKKRLYALGILKRTGVEAADVDSPSLSPFC